MARNCLFFLLGLILLGGCVPSSRFAWVGPGDLPQVRYQCMRETGGSEIDELTGLAKIGRSLVIFFLVITR